MEAGVHRTCRSICPVSDPTNPHKLCERCDPPFSVCFFCKGVQHQGDNGYLYYYCFTCDLEFHRGCHLFSPEIKHPFHLLHPLTVVFLEAGFDVLSMPMLLNLSYFDSVGFIDSFSSDKNSQKCISCRRNLGDKDPFYHCSICNISLHLYCALNPPPLTIENLKSHEHTLALFPRQVPLPCNACGFSLDASLDPVYSCLLCNYMVHKKCIYLPRVIKITRHHHRLSHTSSIVPPGDFYCGVCRKHVDISYGQYSCNKGCHYTVHSKCATKDQVWDGKDLEGVPEEEEEVIDPFVRIDEDTIQHFSHEHHHLKIHGNGHHGDKFCQACTLHITVSDRFYCCVQCNFVLHEECASLPRIKYHPVHKHPLNLFNPFSPRYPSEGLFTCDGCARYGCGFMYKCREEDCSFKLDVRCASLPDPSIHDCHPRDHPLFFNLTQGVCMGCKANYENSRKYIECIKCDSALCLRCATLPCEVHYKHDKHPLTLCYGEEKTTDLKYWCEICETELDATKWFYTCNSCSVTLHVTCLLGKDVHYVKPNHNIDSYGLKVYIGCNNGNTRPVCDVCRCRCIYNLIFKTQDDVFCSLSCYESKRQSIVNICFDAYDEQDEYGLWEWVSD